MTNIMCFHTKILSRENWLIKKLFKQNCSWSVVIYFRILACISYWKYCIGPAIFLPPMPQKPICSDA